MGRKKKQDIELVTETAVEATDIATDVESAETSQALEAEEAEALTAEAEGSEELSAESEDSPEKTAKAAAKAEADAKEEIAAEVTRSKRRASRAKKENGGVAPEADLREEVAVASVTVQRSMESMVKQWVQVKEITGTLATNLERIQKQMADLQANYDDALERLNRQVPMKPAPISKVAMAVAGLSIVVSLLSFSFAQSARNSHLPSPSNGRTAQTASELSERQERSAPQIAASVEGMEAKKFLLGERKKNTVKTKK